MVSNRLENYEVLSILGGDIHSTYYKVKHRISQEIFAWKAINFENFTEVKKAVLLSEIEKQKSHGHPHLVKVFDYVVHEDTKILYLVSEFCANGNLKTLVQKCVLENQLLSEDFVWQVLYQAATAVKTTGNCTKLSASNIYFDADYKVKIFSNKFLNGEKKTHVDFGSILCELCMVKNNDIKQLLAEFPKNYSSELKELSKFMLLNENPKITTDVILCHPTILLKSQLKLSEIFIRNENPKQFDGLHPPNEDNENAYRQRLENLKNRETALKIREEKLTEKLHDLHKREKKVALSERMVREKISQAELYLKRCREAKSSSSRNSSSTNKISYDKIDTSFSADCGDSVIIPTSNKMIPQHLKKPANFSRSMSERRVRFKGHSPLKEMWGRNARNSSVYLSNTTIREASSTTSEEVAEGKAEMKFEDKTHRKPKKKLDLFGILPGRGRKALGELNGEGRVLPQEIINDLQLECRPVSWTEESKQQAFDLLRLMTQNEGTVVKHTYL